MNIAGINYESIHDGEGVRTAIYVSGCSHKCPNCHNPQTHNVNYGIKFTNELQDEIVNNIKKRPFVSGITLSGGDPLYDQNAYDVLKLIERLKNEFPTKDIWLYTGYTMEQIFPQVATDMLDINRFYKQRIVEMCDVVVDGRYIDSQRDLTLKFAGSKNQRVIDVQKSIKENKVVLYN